MAEFPLPEPMGPPAQDFGFEVRIAWRRDDPEIADLIAQGRFFDLLHNEKILDAANDQQLIQGIKKFDMQQALDYAVKRQ